MVSASPIILALDRPTEVEVWDLIDRLEPSQCRLKVGKELFTACGPSLVRRLVSRGYDVFLDLKYHDIPHTVAQACRQAADLGVWMVDVHASGGRAMLDAARRALDEGPHSPLLIAITLLTSLCAEDLQDIGWQGEPQDVVLRLAHLAADCDLDGVVCSAQEVALLRARLPATFCLVTPGIRLPTDQSDDQQRIVTPQAAMAAGSSYLVVGRPITRSKDPLVALQHFNSLCRQ
ncbi:MAG: orotidine-5'-phosphate decarboxylase [Betaproteobacteria bacterium]|nr:orotidine-5'-phosphate decarboxylase [Betaproteobacteria bacterium]